MSLRIIVLAAVVFTCQVNAQMGGIIRPFAAGFSNGLNEMVKPFVQFGQNVISPAGNRRPQMSQWMSYPSQMYPQVQTGVYEGIEAPASGIPGGNYFQMSRPNQVFQPHVQYLPMNNRPGMMRPPQSYPLPGPAAGPAPGPALGFAPGPAPGFAPPPVPGSAPVAAPGSVSSSSEESEEIYTPSNLLIQPDMEVESQTPEELTVEGNVDIPTLQRPLPVAEDQE